MSLLDFLTTRNPTVDSTNSRKGRPTENAQWPPITGCEPLQFDYKTILSMFGDVLKKKFDGPSTSPKLSAKEKEVSDEDSLKAGPLRDIVPKVNAALRFGIKEYYGDIEPIEICSGGHAPRGENDDTRFRADLATVQDSRKTTVGYVNICPGEVKLSTKWSFDLVKKDRYAWSLPLSQLQAYAGEQWKVPWAFLITQEECITARISRPEIGPGIAASRSKREQQHTRAPSLSTVMSSMSLDTNSYKFDGKNVEYSPIQVTRALWADHGHMLTVKLLLWATGMIVAGGILTIKPHYPPLDSWSLHGNRYRHATTGIEVKRVPKDATIVQESGGEAFSTQEDQEEYVHCRVRSGTNKSTNARMIGIRMGKGKCVWTLSSEWKKFGSRHQNAKHKVYYEDGEENISDNNEEDEEEREVAPERKEKHAGKGKGKERKK